MKARLKLLLLAVFAFGTAPAQADTVTYTDSGTFTASTPSDAFGFSGPGIMWAFSFQADTNPALSDVGMGGFSFAFSDFSYSLGGSAVAITPTFIRFFSGTNDGGFAICFDGATFGTCSEGLATVGPQMYSGTTSAPTLLAGTFVQDGFGVIAGSTSSNEPNTTLVGSIPEPSTFLTLAAGLLTLSGLRRSRPRCK